MKFATWICSVLCLLVLSHAAKAANDAVQVSDLAAFAGVAAADDQSIRLAPGVYRMADYLTDEVLADIRAAVDRTQRRPPVPMMTIRGNGNQFDLRGVVIEIDTSLYPRLPGGGYVRCLIVDGKRNHFRGLTIRNTGPQQGSNGNILSIAGERNTLEDVTLYVHGSFPYGYGDLLGKGGPNLVSLKKQSGIQVLGTGTTLRRCKVFSRAFGHCFYIQGGNDVRLEDCYAEGVMRDTNDMLRDTDGPAHALGFASVYPNRQGRYRIAPGYRKSLVEDGYRTYSGAGNVTLVNCTAIHTRAGFEIGARDDSPTKTILENCVARGCERAYLLGSHVVVRRSSGDATCGPLLYLRGGQESDIELELVGAGGSTTVHALATIAGANHRVKLTALPYETNRPALPILLGFGMPAHAEMASPILPAPTRHIILLNEISHAPIIVEGDASDCHIEAEGLIIPDADARKSPGDWG